MKGASRPGLWRRDVEYLVSAKLQQRCYAFGLWLNLSLVIGQVFFMIGILEGDLPWQSVSMVEFFWILLGLFVVYLVPSMVQSRRLTDVLVSVDKRPDNLVGALLFGGEQACYSTIIMGAIPFALFLMGGPSMYFLGFALVMIPGAITTVALLYFMTEKAADEYERF